MEFRSSIIKKSAVGSSAQRQSKSVPLELFSAFSIVLGAQRETRCDRDTAFPFTSPKGPSRE